MTRAEFKRRFRRLPLDQQREVAALMRTARSRGLNAFCTYRPWVARERAVSAVHVANQALDMLPIVRR